MSQPLLNRTYPDAYLDHWGRVYLANPGLKRRGVLFETFLIAPREILMAASAERAEALEELADENGHQPLLPTQRHVQVRLEAAMQLRRALTQAAERAILRGTALVEKLPTPDKQRRGPVREHLGGRD